MRWRALAVVTVVLLVAAPASAQEILQFFVEKVAAFIAVMILASFVFQVSFVRLAAGGLGLVGSVWHALGAVILGGMIGFAMAIGSAFTVFAMPAAVQGLVVPAAWMSGLALAVKILFKCEFPKALLITLVASTLNMVGVAVVMILMY